MRYNLPENDYIKGIYADHLFELKSYLKAAELYIQTSRSFESIFLRFIS